jgi:hypothetical protein
MYTSAEYIAEYIAEYTAEYSSEYLSESLQRDLELLRACLLQNLHQQNMYLSRIYTAAE